MISSEPGQQEDGRQREQDHQARGVGELFLYGPARLRLQRSRRSPRRSTRRRPAGRATGRPVRRRPPSHQVKKEDRADQRIAWRMAGPAAFDDHVQDCRGAEQDQTGLDEELGAESSGEPDGGIPRALSYGLLAAQSQQDRVERDIRRLWRLRRNQCLRRPRGQRTPGTGSLRQGGRRRRLRAAPSTRGGRGSAPSGAATSGGVVVLSLIRAPVPWG